MKLIIDIPEENYKQGTLGQYFDCYGMKLHDIILNGTPILDNATNGDVIKALFPNTEVDNYDYGKDPVIDIYGIDDTEYITLRKTWWNAPYKKGDK